MLRLFYLLCLKVFCIETPINPSPYLYFKLIEIQFTVYEIISNVIRVFYLLLARSDADIMQVKGGMVV